MSEQICQLAPGLWIGSEAGLEEHWRSFTAIVSLIEDFSAVKKFACDRDIVWRTPWLTVQIVDGPQSNMVYTWDAIVAFVEANRKLGADGVPQGRVLVHCWVGASRSVSTCMAILKAERPNKTFVEILGEIKDVWPRAKPKAHWIDQLELWWANRDARNK